MGFIRKKVLIVVLSIMGVLLLNFGLATLNSSAEKNISPPQKNADVKMMEKIEEKLSGKYDISGVSIKIHVDNNTKDIYIGVLGSQEYYDSVKNEVKDIVKSLIKSTKFEAYNVNVKKSESPMVNKELLERHNLISEIGKTIDNDISKAHSNYFDKINMSITPPDSPPELIIEVDTFLERNNQETIGKEIENTIHTTLGKKLFSNKLVNESTVKIFIYNKHKEKINTSF